MRRVNVVFVVWQYEGCRPTSTLAQSKFDAARIESELF